MADGASAVLGGRTLFGPEDEPNLRIGTEVLSLMEKSAEWVSRRVEHVTFLDAVAYRHTLTVTLDLPQVRDPMTNELTRPRLLPLALLAKQPQADLTVTDSSGHPMPYLARAQNDWVTWSVLVTAAKGVLVAPSLHDPTLERHEIRPETVAKLRSLAECDFPEAATVRDNLYTNAGTDSDSQALLSNDPFERLFLDLSRNWILLVPTPPDGDSFVWKISYVTFLRWGIRTGKALDDFQINFAPPFAVTNPPADEKGARYRWWRWKQFQRMGWSPARFAFPAPSLASARSFHFQFESPPGMYVTTANLTYSRLDGSSKPVQGICGGHWAHVYSPIVPYAKRPKINVDIVPIPRGLVRHAAVAGLFSASILTVFLAFLSKLTQTSFNAPAAVLLAVPSIVLSLLGRPELHEIPSSMLSGVKWCLFVSSMCLYTAALTLLLTPHPYVVYGIWLVLLWIAWTSAWWLGKSYLTPRRFMRAAAAESYVQSRNAHQDQVPVPVVATGE